MPLCGKKSTVLIHDQNLYHFVISPNFVIPYKFNKK